MGLLDKLLSLDVGKVANNDAFQLGMNVLANNQGNFGSTSAALGGGLQDYTRQQSLIAQQNRANAQALRYEQEQKMRQGQWLQQQDEYKRQLSQYQRGKKQQDAAMKLTGGLPVDLWKHQNPNYKASDVPSSMREWQIYNKMPQKTKEQFLNMKRAGQTFNTGATQGHYNPVNLQPMPTIQNQLKPQEQINYLKGKEQAIGQAKSDIKIKSELKDLEASFPRLEQVVKELSDLGKKATYTKIGQARDYAIREMGLNVGESAIARKEYTSKVDNEILPLLRQTFGAAFTQKEGESLKATLGDPNASPEEKDAVLRSFIKTKAEQIETLKRKSGTPTKPPVSRSDQDILNQYGL